MEMYPDKVIWVNGIRWRMINRDARSNNKVLRQESDCKVVCLWHPHSDLSHLAKDR